MPHGHVKRAELREGGVSGFGFCSALFGEEFEDEDEGEDEEEDEGGNDEGGNENEGGSGEEGAAGGRGGRAKSAQSSWTSFQDFSPSHLMPTRKRQQRK